MMMVNGLGKQATDIVRVK